MAKDKSKKAEKASTPEVEPKGKKSKGAASSSDFAKPSEAPAGGGDSWNLTEEGEGRLILFTPLREQDEETSDYGIKKVVVADVVVINEKKPEKSEVHDDVYVWGGFLRGSLRPFIGERRVLGRLVKGKEKMKGNYPWLLEDATEAEVELAQEYIASVKAAVADELGGKSKKAKK